MPTSTKAMRCSFTVNGIPAEGSFAIRTKDLLGYGTQIDYLLGIYAPSDQFNTDASLLLESLNSVQFNSQYRNICIPPIGGNECTVCNGNDCCPHQCDEQVRTIQVPPSYQKTMSDAIQVFLEMQGIELLEGDVWGHRKDLDEYYTVEDSTIEEIRTLAASGATADDEASRIQRKSKLSTDLIKYIAKSKITA